MNYKYSYEPLALAEYKEIILWYNERSATTAENFVIAVNEKIKLICTDPLRYRNIYKHFRETSLKKYPYCIVYFLDENEQTVIITSLYHHRRNPKKKYKQR